MICCVQQRNSASSSPSANAFSARGKGLLALTNPCSLELVLKVGRDKEHLSKRQGVLWGQGKQIKNRLKEVIEQNAGIVACLDPLPRTMLCDMPLVWQAQRKRPFPQLHFLAPKSEVGCRSYKLKP